MNTQINATQMKQGDVISFYGAEFILGEVKSRNVGTEEEVYWARGVCINPPVDMLNDYYFYDPLTKEYAWQFQGNSYRTMIKAN
jgi:hypothetical protein